MRIWKNRSRRFNRTVVTVEYVDGRDYCCYKKAKAVSKYVLKVVQQRVGLTIPYSVIVKDPDGEPVRVLVEQPRRNLLVQGTTINYREKDEFSVLADPVVF